MAIRPLPKGCVKYDLVLPPELIEEVTSKIGHSRFAWRTKRGIDDVWAMESFPSIASKNRFSVALTGRNRSRKVWARLIRTAAAPGGSRSSTHTVSAIRIGTYSSQPSPVKVYPLEFRGAFVSIHDGTMADHGAPKKLDRGKLLAPTELCSNRGACGRLAMTPHLRSRVPGGSIDQMRGRPTGETQKTAVPNMPDLGDAAKHPRVLLRHQNPAPCAEWSQADDREGELSAQ